MLSGNSLKRITQKVVVSYNCVQVRKKAAWRIPVTDVEPLKEKLDPLQYNIPVVHRRHELNVRRIEDYIKFRHRHFVYDLINKDRVPYPNIEVILMTRVPGEGEVGARLTLPGDVAYANYIVPGLAVYASPENVKRYKTLLEEAIKNTPIFSSLYVERTMSSLSALVLSVRLNSEIPWTIEKWHIRVAFRRTGFVVPDDSIELPSRPISGPNPEINGKHFIVTVTLNNRETVSVRCVLHPISMGTEMPIDPNYWMDPIEPIFEEDAERFKSFPPAKAPPNVLPRREKH